MTFEDVPDNVRDLPLDDEVLAADVVDLFVPVADRFTGCLGAMICDEQLRGIQPLVVAEVPDEAGGGEVARFVDVLSHLLDDGSAVVLARGRPGSSMITDDDRTCHQVAIESCREHGIRLLGFHVATPDEVVSMPPPLSATA